MNKRRSIFDSYTPTGIIPDSAWRTGVGVFRAVSFFVSLGLALLHSVGSIFAIPAVFLVTLVLPARFPLPDTSALGLCLTALSAFVVGCQAVLFGDYDVFAKSAAIRTPRVTVFLQEIVALTVLYRVSLQAHPRFDLSPASITAASSLIIGALYGKALVRKLKRALNGD